MCIKEKLNNILHEKYSKTIENCTDRDLYFALLKMTKEIQKGETNSKTQRKLYYFSAEFLVGKLLSNNLMNLGIYDEVEKTLSEAGHSIEKVEEFEPEPSLGNGGLGRLAACFLDSIAALGLNGDGVGLNYHYGLFKQKFENLHQTELPDAWIEEQSWLNETDVSFNVKFTDFDLKAKLFQLDIPGYENSVCNKLNLFDVEAPSEAPKGSINFDKKDIPHYLTAFLYPDDSDMDGQLLRVYQQYFMVSAGAQLILKQAQENGWDISELDKHVVIQINDTHPSMIIPEMIRLLIEKGTETDKAISIVSNCCAYTNHTILAEALEKWPIEFIEKVAVQIVPIIKELDRRIKERFSDPDVAIIDTQDRVHMAHMDIHYGFSINGVASLHTDILKESELKKFFEIYPEKFNNKTNGITLRRWLMSCNKPLTKLISDTIGDGWKKDANQLELLMSKKNDPAFLEKLLEIKQFNKQRLAHWLKEKQQIEVNPDSVFDIQIKRLHQYKRQQMNALYAIWKYKQIKSGELPQRPITMFFGAKAAPAYTLAKDIIHLLLCLSKLINNDPDVSPWLKIVMVENYNVSAAQMLIPACDMSEQISLASKEASGTGNMKFMANGAVTLGTMDGANVEISQLVGKENIFIFGKSSDEVISLYENRSYRPGDYLDDEEIGDLVDFIISEEMLALGDHKSLARLFRDFASKDWFMALLDVKEYIETKEKAFAAYEDRTNWAKIMLANIAKSGFFSSDRTIIQYNEDIWKL